MKNPSFLAAEYENDGVSLAKISGLKRAIKYEDLRFAIGICQAKQIEHLKNVGIYLHYQNDVFFFLSNLRMPGVRYMLMRHINPAVNHPHPS